MTIKYKILNLYACLGGNRYKWDEVADNLEITAAEKAGLNHKVRLNNKDYLFCDKISSHTARRSCVSNMLLAGIDRTMIMKLVGWSSEREFAKYDKITKEMAAAKLGKHEFYKK